MLSKLIFLSGFAGVTVFIGGLLANYFNHHVKESPVKYEVTHTMMSFGAGIILAAVALVLMPYGIAHFNIFSLTFSFLLGSVGFMLLDHYLEQKGGKTATLLAMLMDFVPESIALGAVFAVDVQMATLLAIIIGLQNLPEAFNSFRDLVLSGFTIKKTLVILPIYKNKNI